MEHQLTGETFTRIGDKFEGRWNKCKQKDSLDEEKTSKIVVMQTFTNPQKPLRFSLQCFHETSIEKESVH